jgi:HSP20 family molecular chaperone IbpA
LSVTTLEYAARVQASLRRDRDEVKLCRLRAAGAPLGAAKAFVEAAFARRIIEIRAARRQARSLQHARASFRKEHVMHDDEDTMEWMPWLSAGSFVGPPPGSRAFEEDRFRPVFTIHETPEAYDIESELPQARLSDVTVKPYRHHVEVSCGHAIDHVGAMRARRFGKFSTRVDLAVPIDPARAEMSFRHGLLRIHAPKG